MELNEKIEQSDLIDLRLVLYFLKRNFKLIGIYSISLLILSLIFAFTTKKVWEGKFQIVIDNKQKTPNLQSNILGVNSADFLDIEDFGAFNNTLITEVGILESPSVLKPVFDSYLVSRKNKQNSFNKDKLTFEDWKKKYLKIDLKKKTSILNITYKDKNKDLILPVLLETSSVYKDYTIKKKKRVIKLTRDYLINQIDLYKIKSKNSFKEAQEYALDKDLGTLNINSRINNNQGFNNQSKFNSRSSNFSRPILTNIDIEAIRESSKNEIKNIDKQIKKIKELKNDMSLSQHINFLIPEFQETALSEEIINLDLAIADLKSKYVAGDYKLLKLEKRKNILINMLREKSLAFLEVKRISEKSKMDAAFRPKEVIMKYKELIRQASRDETTLIDLENNLINLLLKEAKIEAPWELITEPTLSKKPVYPNKIKLGFLGLLLGTIIGVLLAIYKEIKSGLLYDEKKLEEIFNTKIIDKFDVESGKFEINTKEILLSKILSLESETIKIVNLGINQEGNKISNKLMIFGENSKLKYENNFKNIGDNELIILVINLKYITKKELYKISSSLNFMSKNIYGMILFEK